MPRLPRSPLRETSAGKYIESFSKELCREIIQSGTSDWEIPDIFFKRSNEITFYHENSGMTGVGAVGAIFLEGDKINSH